MQSTELTPFAFGDHLVRVFTDDNGDPWWVAKDVCRVLEIQNARDAISTLDDDEKITVDISDGNPRAGIPNEMNFISESGLYALVFRSRKPEAKAFSKWVRSEVLPTLRKTGRYEMSKSKKRSALPADLPDEARRIPPRMRQKIWQDAIQTARLDGGGSEEARQWFTWLCSLNGFGRPAEGNGGIWNFMDDCLEEAKGYTTSFAKIMAVFEKWWRDYGEGVMPGTKTVSEYVALRYQRAKCSVSVFRNCRIRHGAVNVKSL